MWLISKEEGRAVQPQGTHLAKVQSCKGARVEVQGRCLLGKRCGWGLREQGARGWEGAASLFPCGPVSQGRRLACLEENPRGPMRRVGEALGGYPRRDSRPGSEVLRQRPWRRVRGSETFPPWETDWMLEPAGTGPPG